MIVCVCVCVCVRRYGLTNKQKTEVYVTCATSGAAKTVQDGALYIETLTSSASVTVVEASAVPDGCSVSVVNELVSGFILLKGILNPAEELKKLEKRQKEVGSFPAPVNRFACVPQVAAARCVLCDLNSRSSDHPVMTSAQVAKQQADLQKRMADPLYLERVPERVREENTEKAAKLEQELKAVTDAMTSLGSM
jgi:valyl-tRNA synthetase